MAFDGIAYVRPQFLFVPGLQSLRVEMLRSHKVSDILAVARHIPAELREDQILRIENEEAEVPEASGEEFGHPRFVIFRKGSDCGVMHMDFVFSGQTGTFTPDSLQFFGEMPWNERAIIEVVCAARKLVGRDGGKAAEQVKLARLAKRRSTSAGNSFQGEGWSSDIAQRRGAQIAQQIPLPGFG